MQNTKQEQDEDAYEKQGIAVSIAMWVVGAIVAVTSVCLLIIIVRFSMGD